MSDDEDPTCERCGREALEEDVRTVEIKETRIVCNGCEQALSEDIERYDWRDRYTEEQHERAVSLLASRSEIQCVISSYEDGQIIVHTPYVSSEVVTDFCEHFGLQIGAYYPRWSNDVDWPCMTDHGSTFEVVLEYTHHCPHPAAINTKFFEYHIDDLDGNDKQF